MRGTWAVILVAICVVLLAGIWVPLALAQDQTLPIDPEALLASYGGIVILTYALIELAGRWIAFGPDSEKSLKPLAALILALILGAISKLSGIAFTATKWPVFIGAIAYYAVLGTLAINKVLKPAGIQIPNLAAKAAEEKAAGNEGDSR